MHNVEKFILWKNSASTFLFKISMSKILFAIIVTRLYESWVGCTFFLNIHAMFYFLPISLKSLILFWFFGVSSSAIKIKIEIKYSYSKLNAPTYFEIPMPTYEKVAPLWLVVTLWEFWASSNFHSKRGSIPKLISILRDTIRIIGTIFFLSPKIYIVEK